MVVHYGAGDGGEGSILVIVAVVESERNFSSGGGHNLHIE